MPNLQLHQLRVAAVGKTVCDHFKEPINTRDVVLACLFHDMGNIIKFDLTYFPDFTEPEGLIYWQQIKDEYVRKYGLDHQTANVAIAHELMLSSAVVGYIDSIGFSNAAEIFGSDSYEQKVCEYADARVGPHGILTIEERFIDGRKRYLRRSDVQARGVSAPEDEFEALLDFERKMEKQLFAETSIAPEDINDVSVSPLIEELWEYPIS